jgi:hypothetical protein
MTTSSHFGCAVLAFVVLSGASSAHAAKPTADIVPPETRKASVDKAEHLARAPAAVPLPNPLLSPFNPPGFDKSDRADNGAAAPSGSGSAGAAQAAQPATDREALAAVAAKIPTTGTINLGGKPLLISGVNKIEIGSHFTVVYNGQEYELELVAITSTTFTVRYKGEEYTRPIRLQVPTKQGK